MEFSEAVNWVKSNQGLIKKTIGKYSMFSPYEETDYMQDAFESAMVATLRSKSKGISFESAFWQVFRKNLSDVTPNLKSSRYGSNSVPSFLCSEDTETTEISERKEIPGPDIEAVFQLIRNHLTEREKTVFTLALGLTESGALSSYEIAERLNCSAPNIRIASIRVYERIKRLVEEGVINPNSFIDIGQPVCISSAGGA